MTRRDDGITRRDALMGLAGLAGVPLGPARAGAAAPECLRGRVVRWLVGYSPGGGYDAYARLIEPSLERVLQARIMIQNVPGAAGAVALRTLAAAGPDGQTIGIFDGPGALWSFAVGERGVPDPARDLTILGRAARLQHMLVTGPGSGARSLEDLVSLGRRRRLVFGATATNSQNFVSCAVTSRLFGLDVDYVAGYPGSRELTLALVRGDFDAMSLNVESGLDAVLTQGIVPLYVVSSDPLPYPELERVPRLGTGGEPDRRLLALFATDRDEARALGQAVSTYVGFGRVIAAPAGLPDPLRSCLEQAVWTALRDPALAAAAARARRTLVIADATEVRRDLAAARAAVMRIVPIAVDAARRAR